jgi:hypothetical protein
MHVQIGFNLLVAVGQIVAQQVNNSVSNAHVARALTLDLLLQHFVDVCSFSM